MSRWQRAARLFGRKVEDFQDLAMWRHLVVAALRIARAVRPTIVVPMAFSNTAYLDEIRNRVQRFEPVVVHLCLVAPVETVHARLRQRGADRAARRGAVVERVLAAVSRNAETAA